MAAALIVETRESHELAAAGLSLLGPDLDADGLADSMEIVLRTSPDVVDSDFDLFHDLEEMARKSDPLDAGSTPETQQLGVGMFAYVENGILALHTAIYVRDGQMGALSFELGVVINGRPIKVAEQTYTEGTLAFFYPSPQNPSDAIVVLEMPVPEWIVDRLGKLSVYSIVRDTATGGAPPAVDVLNIAKQGDQTMQMLPAPAGMMPQHAGGVVYRPLSGDGSAPTNSTSQKICWQHLVPVGTNGTSIQYEVERANCEDFDSYCNEGECAAKVGTLVELPDPGRILGG